MSVYNFAETIVAGSSAQGGSGIVQQSLKFNDGDTSYLSWTPATAGNRRTWTWSAWVKRGDLSPVQYIFHAYSGNSDAGFFRIELNSTNTLRVRGWGTTYLETTALFGDASAWYHIVLVADTTQAQTSSTASDSRIRLYVNGVQITVFGSSSMPAQNTDLPINNNIQHNLSSSNGYSSDNYFDGYLSEINFIDGQALSPTSFGQFTDGSWGSKDYSGSYGTNGFRLNFKDDVISEGFNTVTWRGTGQRQSVSGLGFSPALVWNKSRNASDNHLLVDSLRGASKGLSSNLMGAEVTSGATNDIVSFDGDGFTAGVPQNYSSAGSNGYDIVSWCWEGGGTPTATNSAGAGAVPTAGSVKIDGANLASALAGSTAATKLSANTTRGFSIVTFTADATTGTVAHGLTTAPDLILAKPVNHAGTNWYVQVPDVLPANEILNLDGTTGAFNPGANHFNDTVPTNSVFSYGGYMGNELTGDDKIAYCWHSVAGYSKIGSFTGNGGSNPIDVGFTPAFVLLKRTNSSSWGIFDNTRHPTNRLMQSLSPNLPAIETTNAQMTFVGNTFNDNGYFSDSGTTVIYMAFADTREAAFWKDVSGQGNHWTPNRLDYRDSMINSPANNFATLNPLAKGSGTITFSEGNLKSSTSATAAAAEHGATFTIPKSGKWYWEAAYTGAVTAGSQAALMGIMDIDSQTVGQSGNHLTTTTGDYITYYTHNSGIYQNNVLDSSFSGNEAAATVGFALDIDNGYLFVHLNGTYIGGTPNFSTGANHAAQLNTTRTWLPFFGANGGGAITWTANFGQDSTFSGATTAGGNTDANGIGTFKYAPPADYLALCTENLTASINPSDHFNAVLYTGDSDNDVTVANTFAADLVWSKSRSRGDHHYLQDSVRGFGASKSLSTSSTGYEGYNGGAPAAQNIVTTSSSLRLVGADLATNAATYVAWCWKAGGAPTVDNSAGVGAVPTAGSVKIDGANKTDALAGSIAATRLSANTKAGFSIISYTGTGSVGTVAHGLSSTPDMVIHKNRTDASTDWEILTTAFDGSVDYIRFTIAAKGNSSRAAATSTVFEIGTGSNQGASGKNYIAYCFHSVEGYSKIGKYIGNGAADGTFVHMGFKPAFVLLKKSSASTTYGWQIYDNARSPLNNPLQPGLWADQSVAEAANTYPVNIHSNGIKFGNGGTNQNAAGVDYFYMAFAESPFKTTTAR